MIIVRAELHSAITGKVTELAQMRIANAGGTKTYGNYIAHTFIGRNRDNLDAARRHNSISREGRVDRHPRLREHVWNLVAKALNAMEYGR